MCKNLVVSVVYVVCFLLTYSLCIVVPPTPCPDRFNYFESKSNEIFGAISFENDLSGHYDIEINMTIARNTDKNIRIVRRTADYQIQNGGKIEYYVIFPFNDTFPTLTSIRYQGKLYCIGPAVRGPEVTPLSARNSVDLDILETLKNTRRPPTINTEVTLPPSRPIIIINNVLPNHPECGINVEYTPLVKNGEDTKDGEFPWLVAIFRFSDGIYDFHCAGNLVSETHMISAAHCFKERDGKFINKNEFTLVLGKRKLDHWARGTLRYPERVFVHPAYRRPAKADVAVILLDQPVRFGFTIKPICFWNDNDDLSIIVGKNGTVAGWGKDETGRKFVEEARKVTVPIVSNEDCIRTDPNFLLLTSNQTFCAGILGSGKGPCTGDSGGGFVMRKPDAKYYLRGIVSLALPDENRDCDVNNYVVFADVPKYADWIKEKLEQK